MKGLHESEAPFLVFWRYAQKMNRYIFFIIKDFIIFITNNTLLI